MSDNFDRKRCPFEALGPELALRNAKIKCVQLFYYDERLSKSGAGYLHFSISTIISR